MPQVPNDLAAAERAFTTSNREIAHGRQRACWIEVQEIDSHRNTPLNTNWYVGSNPPALSSRDNPTV